MVPIQAIVGHDLDASPPSLKLATNLLRLADLIAHNRFHGFPERADYLERRHRGDEFLADRPPGSLGEELPLLKFWTGWDSDRLADATATQADLETAEANVARLHDLRAGVRTVELTDRAERAQSDARRRCASAVEEILRAGLWVRVNCYLEPDGEPTADSTCHRWLADLRVALGSYGPLRYPWPWPDDPDLDSANPYIVVCERCSFVALAMHPGKRCRCCVGARGRPQDAALELATHPELLWLTTAVRPRYRLICDVCGEPFESRKAGKLTCSSKCRVAKSRAGKSL
jgi:hypothetical protein